MQSTQFLKQLEGHLQDLTTQHGRHSLLFFFISLLLQLLLLLYTLLNLYQGSYSLASINLALMLMFGVNHIWLQYSGDFRLASNTFLILLFGHNCLVLMHETIAPLGFYFTALFPILAFMFKGSRGGLLWSLVMGSFLVLSLVAHEMGIFAASLPEQLLLSTLISYLLIGLISAAYCYFNAKHLTQLKHSEQLHYLATHDSLTGLVNRNTFLERLEHQLQMAAEQGGRFALMFLDLDHFKRINDTYGHSVGDHILAKAARRVQNSVRGSDLVCRYGGDEFLILLNNLQPENAQHIVRKIDKQFSAPFMVDGEEIFIGISVGISFCPHEKASVSELIEEADREMYSHKVAGRTLQS